MQNITLESGRFPSRDGKTQLAYRIYYPEKPRAVIQLSHGMCEYVGRYDEHARYFASQGFVFCGHDHLGHGESAPNENELGYTGSADCLIDDLHSMTRLIRERFPELPIVLLGHSMGSFIARCYVTRYPSAADAVILSGTAGPGSPTAAGKLLAVSSAKRHGDHYRDALLKSISTGSYSKKFGKNAPASAWVSSRADILEKYDTDPFCNYTFTVNGYYNLFELLGRVSSRAWAKSVPQDLPVLLISGAEDPVGGFGKGVTTVYDRLRAAGLHDLQIHLLENARHEPFNEQIAIRDRAYSLIVSWIEERIAR